MDQFIPVAGPSQDDFDTMSDQLANVLNPSVSTGGDWSANVTGEAKRFYKIGNLVIAYIAFSCSNLLGNNKDIITLPSGYAPSTNTNVYIWGAYAGIEMSVLFTVKSTGEITVTMGSGYINGKFHGIIVYAL